jgi:Protein of unknown function (DUF4245)
MDRVSTQSEVATGRPKGPGRSFTGLLWSLIPIIVVVVLLVLWQRGSASPVPSVDPRPDVAYAQRISPVPLPAPGPLPGTWRSTSSDVDAPNSDPSQADQPKRSPVTLTIGYLTEDDHFAEVVVGDRPATAMLNQTEPGATKDGDVTIGPARWDTYRNQRGEQVLVGTVGRAGVLVTGDASGTDLAALAASLRLP